MKFSEFYNKNVKSKALKALVSIGCVCGALTSVVAFAEDPTTTDTTSQIVSAMNSSITTSVSSAIAMFVGLIPVGLQIITAFILFKLGKKFFGKIAS